MRGDTKIAWFLFSEDVTSSESLLLKGGGLSVCLCNQMSLEEKIYLQKIKKIVHLKSVYIGIYGMTALALRSKFFPSEKALEMKFLLVKEGLAFSRPPKLTSP